MSDMSERQFAKHTGRALATVQEARISGRLVRSVSRDAKGRIRIDPVMAAEEWLANTRDRVTDAGEGGDATRAWKAARARREAALAALAEDELAVKRGELVKAAGVAAEWVKLITQAKTKLLGLPTRARQRLPHLTRSDVLVLEGLIREALEDLADA